jgi:hypothetical protein
MPVQFLRRAADGVGAGEDVQDGVAGVGEGLDEECQQPLREARRVGFPACAGPVAQVGELPSLFGICKKFDGMAPPLPLAKWELIPGTLPRPLAGTVLARCRDVQII